VSESRVALVRGEDRYRNALEALEWIADDIELVGVRRVVIKPNFVSVRNPLSATHVEAVRAVLDFLKGRGVEGVTLAEGPALGMLSEGLRSYGYLPLVQEYGLELVDLNQDEGIEVELYDRNLRPMRLQAARTVVECDYRISVGPPKTHDTVIVTLSLKNMAVGSLVKGHKSRIHQGYAATNLNLYRLAPCVAPHLAVLDGFQAMEGNGPTAGRAVDWRVAMASTDFLAADSLAAELMGFALEEIGYLHYCQLKGLCEGGLEGMELVGNATLSQVQRKFVPHSSYQRQLAWRVPEVERYL